MRLFFPRDETAGNPLQIFEDLFENQSFFFDQQTDCIRLPGAGFKQKKSSRLEPRQRFRRQPAIKVQAVPTAE